MTRKRRNSSGSERERSSSPPAAHSPLSPSTSRAHSSHHSRHYAPDVGCSHRKKHTESGKHYRHQRKERDSENVKMDNERRDQRKHDIRRGEKKAGDVMHGEHRGLKSIDGDVRKGSSSDKDPVTGEKSMEIDGRGKNRDSSKKYGLHKRVKKESEEESDRKPPSGHIWKEKPGNDSRDSIAPPLDKFGEFLRGDHDEEEPKVEKEKPSFVPSGKLAEDTNTFRGVVIKYNEPPDAHMPKLRWRLYPFKGDEALPVLYIHRQSAYLIGRDRKIADLPVDHLSCSKQHAVFQYRLIPVHLPDGTTVKRIRPYIIDLGSANGTYLNNERIEPQRFVELREKDVLKFGFSTREYVLLNEKSQDTEGAGDAGTVKKEVKTEERSPS